MCECSGCSCHLGGAPCSHCMHVKECQLCGQLYAECDLGPCVDQSCTGQDKIMNDIPTRRVRRHDRWIPPNTGPNYKLVTYGDPGKGKTDFRSFIAPALRDKESDLYKDMIRYGSIRLEGQWDPAKLMGMSVVS